MAGATACERRASRAGPASRRSLGQPRDARLRAQFPRRARLDGRQLKEVAHGDDGLAAERQARRDAAPAFGHDERQRVVDAPQRLFGEHRYFVDDDDEMTYM